MTGFVPITMKPKFIGFEGIKKYSFPEGLTLQEIAAEIGPDLPVNFWTGDGVICVNDRRVPQEYWHRVRPKINPAREIVVTFHIVPSGGDKLPGILVTIAGVALVAAGIVFQQGWLIQLGIGVGLAGIGMLLAPPPPQIKDKASDQAIQAGISGNSPGPFEWLPRVLGRMVYSPPFLIRPYTIYSRKRITVGGAVGLVGRHTVTDVRVNGALASSMSNVTTQTKTGAPGDTALTIGNKWIWEESPRLRLSNFDLKTDSSARDELFDQTTPTNSYPEYQTFLTRSGDNVDRVVIRFLFPQGMVADTNDNQTVVIPIRVEFRQRGSSTWILGPEFHFYDDNKGNSEIRQNLTFLWQADATGLIHAPNTDRVSYVAFRFAGTSSWQYVSNTYFSNGSSRYALHVGRDEDGFTVYLDPATFPKGHYEFRIKRGLAYRQGLFTPATYSYNGNTTDSNFFDHVTVSSVDIVRVEQYKIRGDVQIEAFQSWNDDYPLQAALSGGVPLTLIGFEARDMEVNSIAATFESQVPIYSGGNWNTTTASRNPAAHYRHVLLDSLNPDPRDPVIVDSNLLSDWYTFCATNGYQCNAIVTGNEPDVLAMIASAGWAGQRSHEQWEVILERDTSAFAITQLFTPLNSANYVATKAFADLPHAINVEFADETDDYNLTSIIVYAQGFTAANATRFETLRMDGITNQAKVIARVQNLLRVLYNRQVERRIDVGIEALVSVRGDVVGLAHDLKTESIWYGTILRVLTSGGNVTGIIINGKALLSQASPPFSTAIRYMSGQVVLKAIIGSSDTDNLMFTTPFAIPAGDVLRKGCLVSVGVINAEAVRCRVSNIRYKDEFFATVSLVDEAPQIYTGFFAAQGSAFGTGAANGVATGIGTRSGVGSALGFSQVTGVSETFTGTFTGNGFSAGLGTAVAVGDSFGTVAAQGLAEGVGAAIGDGATGSGLVVTAGTSAGIGAAVADGTTINTWGAGLADGFGAAEGIAEESVPSTAFIFKGTVTDTTNKSAGQTYDFTGNDIGVAHAKRIVIFGVYGGNFNTTQKLLVNGVEANLRSHQNGFNMLFAEVPSGTTADFLIEVNSAMDRAAISWGIYYPQNSEPLFVNAGSASGTSDAIVMSIVGTAPHLVVAYGGQQSTLGTFTEAWEGSETFTEDADAQLESATSYFFAHLHTVTSENDSYNVTLESSASGTKNLIVGSWALV